MMQVANRENKLVTFDPKKDVLFQRGESGKNYLLIHDDIIIPIKDVRTRMSYDMPLPHPEGNITEDMMRDIVQWGVHGICVYYEPSYREKYAGILDTSTIDMKYRTFVLILDSTNERRKFSMDTSYNNTRFRSPVMREFMTVDDPLFLEWMARDIDASQTMKVCSNKAARLIKLLKDRTEKGYIASSVASWRGMRADMCALAHSCTIVFVLKSIACTQEFLAPLYVHAVAILEKRLDEDIDLEEDDGKKIHERIEEIRSNAQHYFVVRAREQAIQQRDNAIAELERVKEMQAPPDRERERDENHKNAQKFAEILELFASRAP